MIVLQNRSPDATSLERFKVYLSCNRVKIALEGVEKKGGKRRGFTFYRVRVISGRNEYYKFVSRTQKSKRSSGPVTTMTMTRTRTKDTKVPTTVRLIRPHPLFPSVLFTPLGPDPSALKIMAARNRLLIIWIRR